MTAVGIMGWSAKEHMMLHEAKDLNLVPAAVSIGAGQYTLLSAAQEDLKHLNRHYFRLHGLVSAAGNVSVATEFTGGVLLLNGAALGPASVLVVNSELRTAAISTVAGSLRVEDSVIGELDDPIWLLSSTPPTTAILSRCTATEAGTLFRVSSGAATIYVDSCDGLEQLTHLVEAVGAGTAVTVWLSGAMTVPATLFSVTDGAQLLVKHTGDTVVSGTMPAGSTLEANIDIEAIRTGLGLGAAAYKAIGTTADTVSAGHAHPYEAAGAVAAHTGAVDHSLLHGHANKAVLDTITEEGFGGTSTLEENRRARFFIDNPLPIRDDTYIYDIVRSVKCSKSTTASDSRWTETNLYKRVSFSRITYSPTGGPGGIHRIMFYLWVEAFEETGYLESLQMYIDGADTIVKGTAVDIRTNATWEIEFDTAKMDTAIYRPADAATAMTMTQIHPAVVGLEDRLRSASMIERNSYVEPYPAGDRSLRIADGRIKWARLDITSLGTTALWWHTDGQQRKAILGTLFAESGGTQALSFLLEDDAKGTFTATRYFTLYADTAQPLTNRLFTRTISSADNGTFTLSVLIDATRRWWSWEYDYVAVSSAWLQMELNRYLSRQEWVQALSSTSPSMDGVAAAGVAATMSRGDHVHPVDTSRAASSHTHTELHTHSNSAALAAVTAAGDGSQYLASDGTYKTVSSGGAVVHNDTTNRDATDAHPQSAITDLVSALAGKAASAHSHAQSDVTDLTTALAGKAASAHTHAQSEVTDLTTALAAKAASTHSHAQTDVTGLSTALAGKSDTTHTHTELHTHSNSTALAAVTAAGSADNYLGEDGAYHAVPTGGGGVEGYPDPTDFTTENNAAPLAAFVGVNGIDEYTRLVLHCDGTDGSTTFTDASPSSHAVTAVGNAQVDTDQSRFGGASALFDGSGAYLSIPGSTDWQFGSGNFTIDFWVREAAQAGSQSWLGNYIGSGGNDGWFIWRGPSTTYFQWTTNGSSGSYVQWNVVPTIGEWVHVRVVRNGNVLTLYFNGVSRGNQTLSATIYASTRELRVGEAYPDFGEACHIDEVRISKGVARCTGNFTPQTTAYSASVKEVQVATGAVRFPAAVYGPCVALTDAASIATDCSLSNAFTVTLGGNRTLAAPTNLGGGSYLWYFKQDATGNRTLAFDTIFRFEGGEVPVLSTAANAIDYMAGHYDGTYIHCGGLVKNSKRI